ncbi:MAG: PLDc N-terminal domain-containing protein [Bellilinea sp.]
MEELKPFIPYLIPVIIIQLGLMVTALVDLARRERTKGPKWMWAIIIVAVNIIGPVVYLLAGKDES